MEVIIKETYEEVSKLAARMIADVIRKKPRAIIGLATGSTPLGTYKELIRMHKEEELDFSQVATFNLDEYVNLPPEHDQSYLYFMNHNLFNHINIKKDNVHVPDGMAKDLEACCDRYEQMMEDAGGIDIQLLGIGSNGHIAFNEPVSSLGSRTRVKTLTEQTRKDNARFFEKFEDVPKYALTMGIGTIIDSRQLILLASGSNKAEALAKTVEGPITAMVPATIIQLHRKVTVISDKEASAKLMQTYPTELQRVQL